MSHKLRLLLASLALLSLPALSACTTSGGVGEDMEGVDAAGRGTDSVGEEGTTGEAESGVEDDEGEEGASGGTGAGAGGTTQ